MNIHHLELFYYVAKHGGIASAVRNIPYGIQQPAVSGQIAKLEESLGVSLFSRRPFALTAAGEELFAYIEPFFSNLDSLGKKIRSNAAPQLRIAAPSLVLQEYVPELLKRIGKSFPHFRLNLHEAGLSQAEHLLQQQEIDLAITTLEKKPRFGLQSRVLLEFPLCLLVPKRHPITNAKELWALEKIEEPLVTFPSNEPVAIQFQRGLKGLCVEWYPSVEVNSIRLIESYVANGFGFGLVPAGLQFGAKVRQLPLPTFPTVALGAVWAGKLPPIAHQFLAEVELLAKAAAQEL